MMQFRTPCIERAVERGWTSKVSRGAGVDSRPGRAGHRMAAGSTRVDLVARFESEPGPGPSAPTPGGVY